MVVTIILWILIIAFIVLIVGSFLDSKNDLINQQIVFEKRFDKLLHNVTTEEWNLYKKIWHKITYTSADYFEVCWVNGEIFSVEINNIAVRMEKHEKHKNIMWDGTPFGRAVYVYECLGIDIKDNKKGDISLNPPKEQIELYDLIVNYIIWKLEVYYKQQEENEKKAISNEHQKIVKEALKRI